MADNGIGMSRDELVSNLGTIARSGTAEFLQQMTGDQQKDAQLIGQFGVGFYSAFIVADKSLLKPVVQLRMRDSLGVRRQGEFTIEPVEKGERGTRVTLHLKEDEAEFAESFALNH